MDMHYPWSGGQRQWEARQIEGVNPPCVGEILALRAGERWAE